MRGYIGIYNGEGGVWVVPRVQRKGVVGTYFEMYGEKNFRQSYSRLSTGTDQILWNEFTSSLIPVGIWVRDKN